MISWTSDRLGNESLAVSILELGSESVMIQKYLMVLAILTESSSGVGVSWRTPHFCFWSWKLNLLIVVSIPQKIYIIGHRRTTGIFQHSITCYCNSLLYDVPRRTLVKLQRVHITQFFGSYVGFLWSTVWNSRFWYSHSRPYMGKVFPTW